MRNWINLFETRSGESILITDIYDHADLCDESELISQYAPPVEWENPLTVHEMPSRRVLDLVNPANTPILKAFRGATKKQRELVDYYIDNFDNTRIIVLYNNMVADGYHHAVAAIKSGRPIRYVDLAEWG